MANLQAAFISLNLIGFLGNILPGIWHIKSKNLPAIALVVYLQLMLINGFVSAIVWGGQNFAYTWKGYGWCDIMVRIQFGTSVGIASSVTCILLKLYFIFLANDITIFWFENKWAQPVTDTVISIGFPILVSGFTYFAQSSRYTIYRYTGCVANLTTDSVSILVFFIWIFFWSFCATVLSVATLYVFYQKRKAAKNILFCTNSGLSVRKFARLLIFCVIVTVLSIILSVLIGLQLRYVNHQFYVKEYNGLWDLVLTFPHQKLQDYARWIIIAISFTNFFIFGFGSDAKEMYLDIIRFFGGEGLIEWVSKKTMFKNERESYLKKFSFVQVQSDKHTLTHDIEIGPSPTEAFFSTLDGVGYSPSTKSGANVFESISMAPTSASGTNSEDLRESSLYNDPAVRSQLMSAEIYLENEDNYEEFKYLYAD